MTGFATDGRWPLLTMSASVQEWSYANNDRIDWYRRCGHDGYGIAQVCAAAGLPVVMTDISDAALTRGTSVVASSLERLVNKQKMTDADRQAALARITTTTDTAKFSTCDLVIEAATENEELKVKI